jgi:hypothetical protein
LTERPFQPARDDVAPDELASYDRVLQLQGGPGRPPGREAGELYGALLQSPVIAEHMAELIAFYKARGDHEGSFSHVDREWTDIVLGREFSPWLTWVHMPSAIKAGVRVEAIAALWEGRDDELTDDERQLADYIRMIFRGTVTPESYAAAEARFGVRGAIEFTAWVSYLIGSQRLMGALQMVPREGMEAKVRQRLAEHRESAA